MDNVVSNKCQMSVCSQSLVKINSVKFLSKCVSVKIQSKFKPNFNIISSYETNLEFRGQCVLLQKKLRYSKARGNPNLKRGGGLVADRAVTEVVWDPGGDQMEDTGLVLPSDCIGSPAEQRTII